MFRLNKVVVGVIAGAVSMSVGMSPAFADGLHIFNNDPNTVWNKGCNVTYSMDSRVAAEYAPYIEQGLAAIGGVMSMTFVNAGIGNGNAMIRYTENDNIPGGAAGWGSTSGSVELSPISKIPDWQNPTINDNIRKNLIVHETLHVFGLDHDMDEGTNTPDEIMYPILPTGPLHFGNGDLTGMAFVKDKNKCGSGGTTPPTAPPTTTPTDPPVINISIPNPGTSLTKKQRCIFNNTTAPHKDIYKWKWNAKKKKCIRSRR